MSSLLLAGLATLGFFAAVALVLGWVYLTLSIDNFFVAMTVFLTPFVAAVFVLSYFIVEAL